MNMPASSNTTTRTSPTPPMMCQRLTCSSCTSTVLATLALHGFPWLLDHSPYLKAGECWADVAHASQPRGTAPSASSVVMGAVVVGPAPPACISAGPTVYPAAYHTGGGRFIP